MVTGGSVPRLRPPRAVHDDRDAKEAGGASVRSPERPVSRSTAVSRCRRILVVDVIASARDLSGPVRGRLGAPAASPRVSARPRMASTPVGDTSRSKASRAKARSCQRSLGGSDGSSGGVSRRRNLVVLASRSFMHRWRPKEPEGAPPPHFPRCLTEAVPPSYQEMSIVNRLPVTIVKRRMMTCLLPSMKNRHYTAAIPL